MQSLFKNVPVVFYTQYSANVVIQYSNNNTTTIDISCAPDEKVLSNLNTSNFSGDEF